MLFPSALAPNKFRIDGSIGKNRLEIARIEPRISWSHAYHAYHLFHALIFGLLLEAVEALRTE